MEKDLAHKPELLLLPLSWSAGPSRPELEAGKIGIKKTTGTHGPNTCKRSRSTASAEELPPPAMAAAAAAAAANAAAAAAAAFLVCGTIAA